MWEPLQQELEGHGYIQGQNLIIERRFADGQAARLPELAAELVMLPVDLIVTIGSFTAEAARDATRVIPIVMVYPDDPVASGLVASLGRPGGSTTGLSVIAISLAQKRLELLKEAVP